MYRNMLWEFESQKFLLQSIQEVWLISLREKWAFGFRLVTFMVIWNCTIFVSHPTPALPPLKLENPSSQYWATGVHIAILPEHTQPQHLLIFILEERWFRKYCSCFWVSFNLTPIVYRPFDSSRVQIIPKGTDFVCSMGIPTLATHPEVRWRETKEKYKLLKNIFSILFHDYIKGFPNICVILRNYLDSIQVLEKKGECGALLQVPRWENWKSDREASHGFSYVPWKQFLCVTIRVRKQEATLG